MPYQQFGFGGNQFGQQLQNTNFRGVAQQAGQVQKLQRAQQIMSLLQGMGGFGGQQQNPMLNLGGFQGGAGSFGGGFQGGAGSFGGGDLQSALAQQQDIMARPQPPAPPAPPPVAQAAQSVLPDLAQLRQDRIASILRDPAASRRAHGGQAWGAR